MATVEVEGTRLYFPAEDKTKPNDRKVLHPETNVKQVLCGNGEKTLEEYLENHTILTKGEEETAQYAGVEEAIILEIK